METMIYTDELVARMQQIAKEARRSFEYTGDNHPTMRDRIYVLRDDAPQWVCDAIKDAHADMLPDDYVYRWTYDALEELEYLTTQRAFDLPYDVGQNWFLPTYELLQFIASHGNRLADANYAIDQQFAHTVEDAAGYAVVVERERVADIIMRACAQEAQRRIDEEEE